MRPTLLLLFLSAALCVTAQKKLDLDRKLDIFWNSKKLRAKLVAEAIALHPGDTIADIGTADGWFSAALSAYADSLTFYLEDIDSSLWNAANFDRAVIRFFGKVQKTPTHQYHYSLGNEKVTGLPFKTFDYVLIIDAYHHFTYRQEMLTHIASLLKPGGKIVLLEAIARKPGDVHPGCRSKIFSREHIVAELEQHGMRLETSKFAGKASRRSNHIFVFASGH